MTPNTNNEWGWEEKFDQKFLYSQFYEFPYNPLNKMRNVIGTQESGTKFRGRAFNIGEVKSFIRSLLSSERQKWEKRKLIIPKGKTHREHDECENCIYLGQEKERQRLREEIEKIKKSENSRDYDFGGETSQDRKHNEMRGMDKVFGYNQALSEILKLL